MGNEWGKKDAKTAILGYCTLMFATRKDESGLRHHHY